MTRPRLTVEELAALRVQLVEGRVVDMSAMCYEDQLALRPFVRPTRGGSVLGWPTTHGEGTSAPNDELNRIVERLNNATTGSPLEDPRGFLKHADPTVLANLLNEDDLNAVMNMRSQLARPQPPEPPKPSREQITAVVLRLHSEGLDTNAIAAKTGQTQFRVIAIIDSNKSA
jgi:hypothetical protein